MKEMIKKWWKKSTLNEKLMYALILLLLVCIATRWRVIFEQIGESFGGLFSV